jgi:hypothetical protein
MYAGVGMTPEHYYRLGIEPWDAMQAWMTVEEWRGFCRGNVIKYVARCNDKGGLEDLQKARDYLAKLIDSYPNVPG